MKHAPTSWAFALAQANCQKTNRNRYEIQSFAQSQRPQDDPENASMAILKIIIKMKTLNEELGFTSVDTQNPVCEAPSWQQGHSGTQRLRNLLQDTHQRYKTNAPNTVPSLTRLQSHWPSRHSLNIVASCLSQGLCTGCSQRYVCSSATFTRLATFYTRFSPPQFSLREGFWFLVDPVFF